jgi:hypothetical protein
VGIGFIATNPLLRPFAARTVIDRFFGSFFAALYALYCLRDLGMGPSLLGPAVAAGGAGDLVGALVAERATRRFGIGPTILAALGPGTGFATLTPLAGGPFVVAVGMVVAAQVVGDGLRTVVEINALSVRQATTGEALLGRVNGGLYLLAEGIGPLGALVGGALDGEIGARETLALAVLGGALANLWIVFSPVRSLRGLPETAAQPAL